MDCGVVFKAGQIHLDRLVNKRATLSFVSDCKDSEQGAAALAGNPSKEGVLCLMEQARHEGNCWDDVGLRAIGRGGSPCPESPVLH